MTFAFDIGGTLTRHPKELWTIMECLRLGGHRVVVLSAIGLTPNGAIDEARQILKQLGNFDAFEVITVPEDFTGMNKAQICQREGICLLIDDAPYNMEALRSHCSSTARIQVVP